MSLINSHDLEDNKIFVADICIIGAGMAGQIIAKFTSENGLKTLVLESGDEGTRISEPFGRFKAYIVAGEGGICVTDSKEYFTKLSFYGHFNRNTTELIEYGLNSYKDTGFSNKLRMSPLGSVLALVDLKYINKINSNKEFFYKKNRLSS